MLANTLLAAWQACDEGQQSILPVKEVMLALDFSTSLLVQAESLRATAETKDINIRIAYGMTVLQMRM